MGKFEVTHLLDTHAWIQRALGMAVPPLVDRLLTEHAGTLAIADISLWEAAKLVGLGRLKLSVSLSEFFEESVTPDLTVLPVTTSIASRVTELERSGFHKDPADQLIVATALQHGLTLVSDDARIRQWGGVRMVWRSAQREG